VTSGNIPLLFLSDYDSLLAISHSEESMSCSPLTKPDQGMGTKTQSTACQEI